jgi:hypothetical protein
MEHWWNDTGRRKQKYSDKTCPSANLSTTNPTCTFLASNLGICAKTLVINGLGHSTTFNVGIPLGYIMKSQLEMLGYYLVSTKIF